jgi:putative heme-binding domain-containing protein
MVALSPMLRPSLILSLFVFAILTPAWADEETNRLDSLVSVLLSMDNESVQINFLQGMASGLSGRRNVKAPKDWEALKEKLKKKNNQDLLKLINQLSQIFGDEGASRNALKVLRNNEAELNRRRDALKSLLAQKHAEVPPVLEGLLDQPFRLDVIRAYATYDYPDAPGILLGRYGEFDTSAKRTVIETLASRKSYARALAKVMGEGKVAKEEIPAYVARNLYSMLGKSFEKVYGKVEQVSADKDKLIAKYKSMVLSSDVSKADASNGRAIYKRTCGACHVMYGEGGKIGPELTGSNRSDLDYFLLNVLAPSYDVPEGYRMVIITSKDGQVSVGNVIGEDANKVVLNMVGQQSVIAKTDVKTRVTSKISMMPEGLLLALKDHEVLDLIKYLRTEKQVPLP